MLSLWIYALLWALLFAWRFTRVKGGWMRMLVIALIVAVIASLIWRVAMVSRARRRPMPTSSDLSATSGYRYREGMRHADESLPARAARRRREADALRRESSRLTSRPLRDNRSIVVDWDQKAGRR